MNRIKNNTNNLLTEGYGFISFDVKSLFTNIPLNKKINIILHKIYNENKIATTLKKRTLKKPLHDPCTKTPFFANGELYRQIDGVAMGPPLTPILANIIMIALEDAIITDLLHNDIIKFYVHFLDIKLTSDGTN